ncbi:MAG: CcoQ/FixQ family Cbb3-type cytochrome c oxidase assembly chaperone [Bacteroidota bacterium]|nr:CcoQ/FixQ family Cbb3-type cytochrome c oxidase assembly chaperone [Bacteroidota bacterium]
MFKQHIQNIPGIQSGYLIFSMLVFIVFFLGIIWWLFKADKAYIEDMKNKPFEN